MGKQTTMSRFERWWAVGDAEIESGRWSQRSLLMSEGIVGAGVCCCGGGEAGLLWIADVRLVVGGSHCVRSCSAAFCHGCLLDFPVKSCS